jgi:hypothetical protein
MVKVGGDNQHPSLLSGVGAPSLARRVGAGWSAIAVISSAASNARWAYERTAGDVSPVVLAAGVPVASFLAFEVLLAELRRQVHRRRGLPAPAAIPAPRLIRLALAPRRAFSEWRHDVLLLTAPALAAEPTLDQPATDPFLGHHREPDPANSAPPDAEPPQRRHAPSQPTQQSMNSHAPGHPRSIEQLRTELAVSINTGTLPTNPSAEAIRKTLRIGLGRARQLRDETGQAPAQV